MAATPIFSDLLPYELNVEIWQQLPYDEVSKLCKTVSTLTTAQSAVIRDICNDPQVWISRAADKLHISPRSFWYRSPVEQGLKLPGRTDGQQAHMKYVEWISRRGAVADSTYFLSDMEMIRRAALENNVPLMRKYLDKLDPKDFTHENSTLNNVFQEISEMRSRYGEESGIIPEVIAEFERTFTRMRKNRVMDRYAVFPQFMRGFRNEPYTGRSIAYDVSDYIAGLIEGGRIDEAEGYLIPALGHIEDREYEFGSRVVKGVYRLGDLEMGRRIYALLPGGGNRYFGEDSSEALAQTNNPEIYRLVLEGLDLQPQYNITKIATVVEKMVKYGRFDNLDALQDLLGDRLSLLDIIDGRTWLLQGSYGLQFAEWIIDHGWTKDQTLHDIFGQRIDLYRRDAIFANKAVKAWLFDN